MIYKLPYHGKWIVQTDDQLTAMKQSGDKAKADLAAWFEAMYHDHYMQNPIGYFLAHSGGVDFINDRTNRLCLIRAGVQVGKSYTLLAKLCLRGIPTGPDWDIYKYGKIKWHKWEGPGRMMMASYEWLHVRTNLWPKLCEILPVDELREYSPKWKSPMARRKLKTVSEHSPSCKLACGTTLDVFCYRSPPESFTSATYDRGAYLDEQAPLHVVKNISDRLQNDPHGQLNEATTPHQIESCGWTGKGSWLDLAWHNVDTLGMTVGRYEILREEVPDSIISPEQRAEIYNKCITYPISTGNARLIRAGNSKYYGTFESSEGLVYDNWNPLVHWIEPFNIPKTWTRYRSIDPGRVDPTCVLWAAVSPWNDVVIYRCYYEAGLGIADNTKKIIELSGNERVVDYETDGVASYKEVMTSEQYAYTVMDPRTFSQPSNDTGTTLGQVWAANGLCCLQGSGKRNDVALPICKEYFEIVPERIHIITRMGVHPMLGVDGKPLQGAPRITIVNTCVKLREELDSYRNKADKPNEPAPHQADHAVTALKYLLLQAPRYMGENEHYSPGGPPPQTLAHFLSKQREANHKQLYSYG